MIRLIVFMGDDFNVVVLTICMNVVYTCSQVVRTVTLKLSPMDTMNRVTEPTYVTLPALIAFANAGDVQRGLGYQSYLRIVQPKLYERRECVGSSIDK